jgi:hypothetical protein
MTILFNFASRSRPEKFFEALNNIRANIASKDYYILAKLDEDDVTMNTKSIRNQLWLAPDVVTKWGTSTSKIHAINRDLNDGTLPKWDILINMSDDMRWGTYGFDEIIRQHMPVNLDGFLHVPDDYAKERVCTTSIIGYRYYQRDMYVYNPAYYSMWCDDEATIVAKERGCYVMVPGVALEHLHYTNERKAVKDELYWRNDTYNKDKVIFEQRKARNFDL